MFCVKIAVVSGASSGIGRAIAVALARLPIVERPEEIWLVARRSEELAATERLVALDVPCCLFPMDLTLPCSFDLLDEILRDREADGGVEVAYLIASAGAGYTGAFSAMPRADAERVIALNCTALTSFVRTFLPYMAQKGRIVTLASAAAFTPQPYTAVYAATKSYVLSFSRALREEARRAGMGVTVTAVCPGPVDTAFFKGATPDGRVPKGKRAYLVSPEHVARDALRAARRGRAVVTPSARMKLARVAAAVLPHAWLVRFFGTPDGQNGKNL